MNGKTWIYLHGFRSRGSQDKPLLLQQKFPDSLVIAPSLPTEPNRVVAEMECLLREQKTKKKEQLILIGSSLGGFYARYISVLYSIPAILINPVITPSKQLAQYIGINSHQSGEQFLWERKHLEQLSVMEAQVAQKGEAFHLYTILLGAQDQKVSPQESQRYFQKSRLRMFDTGHRFDCLEQALEWEVLVAETQNLGLHSKAF
ncbi:MAG: hypothetical protein COB67_11830 [SAR324 cluster bacterium]|uniref:Esterase n=1 Tax=SAR324 cluster bacterium TaxID=2024889 RepID=A0A2A4SS97_9DELT|nr:MAG: hypothetical protein COB67_11830 [SAR324 cluster bacterium]